MLYFRSVPLVSANPRIICVYVYYTVGLVPGDPYIVTVDTSIIYALYISSAFP